MRRLELWCGVVILLASALLTLCGLVLAYPSLLRLVRTLVGGE